MHIVILCNLFLLFRHIGNFSRHTKALIRAQLERCIGKFPVPVRAQFGAKSTVWAQYDKVQYGHNMGTVGAQTLIFQIFFSSRLSEFCFRIKSSFRLIVIVYKFIRTLGKVKLSACSSSSFSFFRSFFAL